MSGILEGKWTVSNRYSGKIVRCKDFSNYDKGHIVKSSESQSAVFKYWQTIINWPQHIRHPRLEQCAGSTKAIPSSLNLTDYLLWHDYSKSKCQCGIITPNKVFRVLLWPLNDPDHNMIQSSWGAGSLIYSNSTSQLTGFEGSVCGAVYHMAPSEVL